MKVNMKQLMGTEWEPEKKSRLKIKRPNKLVKGISVLTLCLILAASFILYQQMSSGDRVSADALYNESEINPSFVVQHMSTVQIPDIQEGEGKIPVLMKDKKTYHTTLDNGLLKTKEKQTELYQEYKTDWNATNTVARASFLNGNKGDITGGYDLSEVWFGRKKDSDKASDFIILSVPHVNGAADLSKVTLTNNPNHPGLSEHKDGYYIADENDKYTICIHNGDVIRLLFKPSNTSESNPVNIYDYDVSDGGYYLKNDYYKKGTKQPTTKQYKKQKNIYVDAIENGIHSKSNYSGNGAKLAFGGISIGTELGDEVRENELDTINIHNVINTETTGVSLGLTSGITADGNIKWADNIIAPDLFGSNIVTGRTSYISSEYEMGFTKEGFTHTLSSIKSGNKTVLKGIEMVTDDFWIGDKLPSYGADGHDVAWGNGSNRIKYYRAGDKGAKSFKSSSDKQNHNSFFGFTYAKDFTLSPGYTGPLDVFGYSDDDLWAYAARIDKDGNIMEDTAVSVIDLGGVHKGTGYYMNLWDVIDPVAYGEEASQWRLFVFWLERDGFSSKCHMRFTLPEAARIDDKQESDSVTIEATDFNSDKKKNRTFIFNDGTNNKYKAVLKDKKAVTITSGKEFTIPSGSTATVIGVPKDKIFTIKETGNTRIWSSSGDTYKDSNIVSGKISENKRVCFVSVENKGYITIGTKAETAPGKGYLFTITLDDVPDSGIFAISASGKSHGYLQMDKDKSCKIAIGADDTLSLYNLPENTEFSVTADKVEGYHVTGISLDGDLDTSGRMISGITDASAIYQYEPDIEDSTKPQVIMEQSVSGDWGKTNVMIRDGMPISYNITVTNPSDETMNLVVKDIVPDGIEVKKSTLSNDGILTDGMIKWNIEIEPKSSVKLPFTGTISTKDNNVFMNSAQVLIDGKIVTESNIVKAMIK